MFFKPTDYIIIDYITLFRPLKNYDLSPYIQQIKEIVKERKMKVLLKEYPIRRIKI